MEINSIIQQHNLSLLKSTIFNKDHIFLVADSSGKKMILKTDRINKNETELLKIAKKMELELCFKVPEVIIEGENFIALEEIEGENLNHYLNNDLNQYFAISKNIANDYQKISSKFKVQNSKVGKGDNLFEGGEKWLFNKLREWSRPIVDDRLIEESRIDELRELFDKIIKQKGESFFDWAHGNIIGDHIIANQKGEYLFDLEVLPRPGRNYYDFLRALDWMFLKSDKLSFDDVIGYLKKYLASFDWKEIKLVFSFRCIGILGCDMLKNGDSGKGDFEQKKRDLIRFIKMDY